MSKFKLEPTEPTESELHRTVAELLNWILMPPAMYTTFPAGWGVLTKATAGRLKGAGLKQGMPDILVFYGGRTIGIELKSYKGKLTRIQTEMHMRLLDAGVRVFVCNSTQTVMAALLEVGFPMRRTRGANDAPTQINQAPESSSAA
jgi:hypothetical protein